MFCETDKYFMEYSLHPTHIYEEYSIFFLNLAEFFHIQPKHGKYFIVCCQYERIFPIFRLNVRNTPHNFVSAAEHCYGSK